MALFIYHRLTASSLAKTAVDIQNNDLALIKHPLLGPFSPQLLDVLEHVEDDVLDVHCSEPKQTGDVERGPLSKCSLSFKFSSTSLNLTTHTNMWRKRELLLTEPLLSQVNVDDEEHEATSSLFLPTDKRVHPAYGINTKR